ncbi:uncharacterized protein BXZ73DRAFT_108084 [Epithele typhae]|uniref:uncharacterized protein n=1 Tax=Epithele typhae TaxID=378194 RepID=UPI0020074F0A|nr:uncharacterized protein BXZ73DRAFT_108084 [Epithele typhae]KAH9911319.1 hypothetical protein BXZ73DRAFT_108084 [Epithele typhae]
MCQLDVACVFALIRNHGESDSDEKLMARSAEVFRVPGLDETLLRSGKVVLRIVDLTKKRRPFGLTLEEYDEIRMSATQIIHNGWTVNFNVSLSSFEPLIVEARRLIDFALGSTRSHKPRVVFSAYWHTDHSSAVPAAELIETPPELAVGAGYSESKWVAEQLLWHASQQTGLSTTSWVPALVRISQKLGCIQPSRDENLTWVPVDVAAAALLEMTRAQRPSCTSAPRAQCPGIPSSRRWRRGSACRSCRTRSGARASRRTRPRAMGAGTTPRSLLAFLESARMGGAEGALDVSGAVGCLKALADVAPLSEEDAERYLGFWDKVEFVRLPE